MLYCINPRCQQRENPDLCSHCQGCGTPLTLQNRYQLIAALVELDEPGNAEIFEVKDLQAIENARTNRKILKVLKKSNKTLIRLFQQEAEALKKLNHSGIPKIEKEEDWFAVKLPKRLKPLYCLVMEKIDGKNLEQWVEEKGKISQEQALNWLKQILKILTHIHQHQYLHRDIKPANIMRKPNGELVLIDFGAIRQMTNTFLARIGSTSEERGTGIVSTGYTAIEQIRGRTVPQSDLYALGRTFVHLLTGIHPLELDEDPKTSQLIWRDRCPNISSEFAAWIDYLMAPYPWQRPLSAAFVLQNLEAGNPPPPIQNENARSQQPVPPWLVALNILLFAVLLVTATLWWQDRLEIGNW